MAGVLHFPMQIVEQLFNEINAATELYPTADMLFDASLYPNNAVLDKNGLTEAQAKKAKVPFWPCADKMDKTKIKASFMLVGDDGLYLMGNHKSPNEPVNGKVKNTVVYAKGCNPQTDDNWYDKKGATFGYDDGSATIPLSWFELAKNKGKKEFSIKISKSSVSLVL